MTSHRVKSRIGGLVCASLLALAGILGFTLYSMEQSGNPDPVPGKAVSLDPYGFPEVDWEYWKSVNPDVIAWVTVPGTNIDSPIVQAHSSDPEYYLHHDVYGKYNVYGCPYLACIPGRKTSAEQDCGEKPPREPVQTVSGAK